MSRSRNPIDKREPLTYFYGMSGLLTLVGMVILMCIPASIIMAILALFGNSNQDKRIRLLEKRIAELERRLIALGDSLGAKGPVTEPVPAPPPAPISPPLEPRPHVGPPAPEAAPESLPAPPTLPPWMETGPRPATPKPAAPEPAVGAAPPSTPQEPAPAKLKEGFERRFVMRILVGVASFTLFLAGIFLVKYSVEAGLLGPTARVTLGILFGVLLLVGGEWMRVRSAPIAQALSAAGIGVLYASFFAATSLYHLIPRMGGFGLMALTTAAAVLLALRHGIWIAVLGLTGGFLTPALIRSDVPNAAGLFTYLGLLVLGLLLASGRRRWWVIGGLAWGASTLWIVIWLAVPFQPGDSLPIGLFLVFLTLAFSASRFYWGESKGEGSPRENEVFHVVVSGSVVLAAVLGGVAGYGALEWGFLALISIGCFVLARLDRSAPWFPWVAAIGSAGLLAHWGIKLAGQPVPDLFFQVAVGMGALFSIGAYLLFWKQEERTPWAALAGLSPVAFFLIAWFGGHRESYSGLMWGCTALAAGVAMVGLTWPVVRRHQMEDGWELSLAALAGAAFFLLSAAVPFAVDRYALTLAWALEIPALVWLELRLKARPFRALAGVLGVVVLARLFFNPFLLETEVGSTPIFNWLLWGYGVPLLAFLAAAWLYRQEQVTLPGECYEGGGILLAVGLAGLEIRHFFHPELAAGPRLRLPLFHQPVGLMEAGLLVSAWLGIALLLAWLNKTEARRSWEYGGLLLTVVGMGLGFFGLGFAVNPAFHHLAVAGAPILNTLLLVYGLPALLFGFLARCWGRNNVPLLARASAVLTMIMALFLVLLEVRQLFHGLYLDAGDVTGGERYSYSAALILFGLTLLVIGIASRSLMLRWASLTVMMIAVGKVFIYDMANLKDLYRVFSFLGLGVSLLLLAYLYQQFVFKREKS